MHGSMSIKFTSYQSYIWNATPWNFHTYRPKNLSPAIKKPHYFIFRDSIIILLQFYTAGKIRLLNENSVKLYVIFAFSSEVYMIKMFVILILSFPVTSHKDLEGRSNVGFSSLIWQLAKLGLRFVSSILRTPCTQRKFHGAHFQLEAVWTPGLLNLLLILGN